MRGISDFLVILGGALVGVAVVGFVAAIWIVGPNSARMAGTASVTFLVGLGVYVVGATRDLR